MIAIYNVLDDRKGEIEFYYSVMEDIDRDSDNMLHTADKQRFFRIMKSKQQFTRGYKRYKETSGLTEWKIGHIFHSIFT